MPIVMATFVQATFVLATFANIMIISGVTDPILTKLFDPILQALDQNIVSSKILFQKIWSVTAMKFMIWTYVTRTNVGFTNVGRTNAGWTNVYLTIGIC